MSESENSIDPLSLFCCVNFAGGVEKAFTGAEAVRLNGLAAVFGAAVDGLAGISSISMDPDRSEPDIENEWLAPLLGLYDEAALGAGVLFPPAVLGRCTVLGFGFA